MKKLFAILVVAVMAFSMASCAPINDAEVAILWQSGDKATLPGSLIDTMERAMYTENIGYKHYGAQGDQQEQIKQAQTAVDAGCCALMVNLVDFAAAKDIISIAKQKDIPLVFFGCEVDESALAGYDKVAWVAADESSVVDVQGKLIGDYVNSKVDKKTGKNTLDRNGDGKLSYAAYGEVEESVKASGVELELVKDPEKNGDRVEIIVTDNDTTALELLSDLWEKGYNKDKLVTHFIPLFTVGSNAEAFDFYDKEELTEEDKKNFIFTVTEIIGQGRIAGTVVENRDGISAAAAQIVRNLIKGESLFTDIAQDSVTGDKSVKISYIPVMAG